MQERESSKYGGGQTETGSRYYVFECRRDRFRFVLVFQVLVCHLKDILLFLPFLFILRHVTWGENTDQLGYVQGRVLISVRALQL